MYWGSEPPPVDQQKARLQEVEQEVVKLHEQLAELDRVPQALPAPATEQMGTVSPEPYERTTPVLVIPSAAHALNGDKLQIEQSLLPGSVEAYNGT